MSIDKHRVVLAIPKFRPNELKKKNRPPESYKILEAGFDGDVSFICVSCFYKISDSNTFSSIYYLSYDTSGNLLNTMEFPNEEM